jgi:hypothetical protein
MTKLTLEIADKALKESINVENAMIEEIKKLRKRISALESANAKLKNKIHEQDRKTKIAVNIINSAQSIAYEYRDFNE